jgi:hypothetical protein
MQIFIQFQMHKYKYDFVIMRGTVTQSTAKFNMYVFFFYSYKHFIYIL